MKIAYAILCDDYIFNKARKYSLEIHKKYNTGLLSCSVPPHITLKQPFNIKDLSELKNFEDFFNTFCRNIKPFVINITKFNMFESKVIFLDIKQEKKLIKLHLRLLEELKEKFGINKTPQEGEDMFHPHCTIALWNQDLDVYKKIFQEYRNEFISYKFRFSRLGIFVYTDDDFSPGSFFMYKVFNIL